MAGSRVAPSYPPVLVALGAIIGKDEAHPAAVKKQQDGGQHQGDLINGARDGE